MFVLLLFLLSTCGSNNEDAVESGAKKPEVNGTAVNASNEGDSDGSRMKLDPQVLGNWEEETIGDASLELKETGEVFMDVAGSKLSGEFTAEGAQLVILINNKDKSLHTQLLVTNSC